MAVSEIGQKVLGTALICLAPFVVGCSSESNSDPVLNFDDVRSLSAETDGAADDLRVAVAAMTGPRENHRYYSNLVNYLAARIGARTTIVQRKTYAEVNNLLKKGDVDMAFLCSGGYIQAAGEGSVTLLCAPVIDGRSTYQSYLIVPATSLDTCLLDLRGKVFAFTDPLSNTGCIYPNWFAQTVFTHGHDNSIQTVARGIVDGAAVDGLVYEYLKKHRPIAIAGTRVAHKSPDFGIPPVVTRKGLSTDLRNRLLDAMLSMDRDSTGAEILGLLEIERFVVVDDSLYASVRAMKHD
jgi:phosphonate transport system substrate-binding protein